MKHLLSLLLSLVTLTGFSQFPTKQSGVLYVRQSDRYMSIRERAQQEGIEFDNYYFLPSTFPSSYTAAVTTPSAYGTTAVGSMSAPINVGSINAPYTKMHYVLNLEGAVSDSVYAAPFLNTAGIASTNSGVATYGGFKHEINALMYGGEKVGLTLFGPVWGRKKVVASYHVKFWRLSSDTNYGADQIGLVFHDSNWELSSCDGATTRNDGVSFKLTNWFNSSAGAAYRNGNSFRFVDKSLAGQNSSFVDGLIAGGRLQTPANFILYGMGTNETDTVSYRTRLKAFIAWKQAEQPAAKMMLLTPLPASAGSAKEALMVQVRACGLHVYNETKDNTIYFFDQGGTAVLPTNSNDTYYTTTDGTNSANRIHLNKSGQSLWATAIQNFIIANNIVLPKSQYSN